MKVRGRLLIIAASFLILIGGGLVLFSLQEMYAQEKKTKDSLALAKDRIQNGVKKESKNVLQTEQPLDVSFEQGEVIGILKIPRLKAELPIIEGTDEDNLKEGLVITPQLYFQGSMIRFYYQGIGIRCFAASANLKSVIFS